MGIIKNLICVIFVGFFFFSVEAQNTISTQFGLPFLQNYSAQTYKADYQNYAITQDKRGVMYFGNQLGVLVFEGVHWQLISLTNQSPVKSLKADNKGRIYVGGVDELGYLKPDKTGTLQYVSLVDRLPLSHQTFGDVLQIFDTQAGIYFITSEAIFQWQNQKIIHIKTGTKAFVKAFEANNQRFVQSQKNELLALDVATNQLKHIVTLNEPLAAVLPYKFTQQLLVSQSAKFYVLREGKLLPWQKLNAPLLQNQQVNCAVQLSNGSYAIGSKQIGLVIVSNTGHLIRHFEKNTGLLSNGILALYSDRWENLWLGMNRGITQMALNAPYALIDERQGLQGQINQLLFHNNKLYAATSLSMFRKRWAHNQAFERVTLANGNVKEMFLWKDQLLVGHSQNLLNAQDSILKIAVPQVAVRSLTRLPGDSLHLLALAKNKILLLRWSKDKGQWEVVNKLPGFGHKVTQLMVDQSGNIWLPHFTKGIYKLTLNTELSNWEQKVLYTTKQGLPSNIKNTVHKLGNEVVFATQKGVYVFDEKQKRFTPHPRWQKTPLHNKVIEALAQDQKGNLWFATEVKTGVLKFSKNNQPIVKYLPQVHKPSQILPLPDQSVAFVAQEGIVIYDPKQKANVASDSLRVLIHKIEEDAMGKDTVFFGGAFANNDHRIVEVQNQQNKLALPYKNNSLRFVFALPYYQNSQDIVYQHILENFDTKWSQWNKNTEKEYTNLPEGTYTFKVKARTAEGSESLVTQYTFVILAPWYRTFWAYTLYVLGIGLSIFLVMKISTRNHRKRRAILQRKIDENTAKIQEQKEIIEASLKAETEKNYRLKSQEKILRKHLDQLNAAQKEVEQKSKMIETQKKKLERILSEKIEQNDQLQAHEEVMQVQMDKLINAQEELKAANATLHLKEEEMLKSKQEVERALAEARDKNDMMEAQEEEMRQNMEELLTTQEEIEKTQLELNSQIKAIDNSPIVKAEYDLHGKVISANKAFLELFYYDDEQIGELYHQMLVDPHYASSFEYDFFWDNLRNGSLQPGEYKRFSQQEDEIWLNATYFPAVNKRGQVFKIIMLAFDITEARQLLKDFQRQAEILRVQEEELRQNMEELVSTQEALQKESSKIESKNRLIMSSIQYAQNIQQAILPTKNTMKELFEDSFVVFIPKDIVSGDFYWTTQVRKRVKIRNNEAKSPDEAMLPGFQVFTFLAVVDCTGHGVPGAFMSMIGNSLLNEIVNNQKKYSPARILQLMHEGIRTRLMQSETSNRDGMDVCLCRLEYRDDDKIEMTFAGAKRPVFLVREGELTRITGDMESIGGWLEGMQRDYENKTFELEKNDTLYLTSDGFVDSASPRRKKFGEKRFRKMLAEHGHLPMNEQRKIVVKALAEHQQDTEQRDDITIVGIKV
ncbi:SpoIIE family protein phosphatase [uncultured Microscilla sp.]|uniref:SpoIIE family protein phosphatase n=1 Tax=uncultured Microscilla sp. TaxID=432653 RepID=UPI0026113BF7|nr:SpoIIE family protein phosphatase [uncultured Microscilla sp.]